MQEIRCPHCGEVFQVDETGYRQIAQQVRDQEFAREMKQREAELADRKARELELIRMQDHQAHAADLARKSDELARREQQIAELRARLDAGETAKELAVKQALEQRDQDFSRQAQQHSADLMKKDEAISQREQQIAELRARLDAGETEKTLAVKQALEQRDQDFSRQAQQHSADLLKKEEALSQREQRITELQAQLKASETERLLAVAQAMEKKNQELSQKENDLLRLRAELANQQNETRLSEKSLREQYEEKLRLKDEQIEYYKDFKARQSTKMIGESLEQHCQSQFNSLRMTAFPNAYFEKDNDARTGSKGDFIYREKSEDGTEFISIMFEMKNEADATATKHRNEDFFRELDKDRREKGCEYAILVSLLEIDSDFYNNGIVDVSYRYPKMYVIRPQFFIPIITLLRNAALNSLQYRRQLQVVQNQQLDIVHFEENMNTFKETFGRNYRIASERFRTAIDEIDKTISHLQKTKDALLSSENNLRLANNKAEDLSIKRLTRNAPAVKAMFDDLKADQD